MWVFPVFHSKNSMKDAQIKQHRNTQALKAFSQIEIFHQNSGLCWSGNFFHLCLMTIMKHFNLKKVRKNCWTKKIDLKIVKRVIVSFLFEPGRAVGFFLLVKGLVAAVHCDIKLNSFQRHPLIKSLDRFLTTRQLPQNSFTFCFSSSTGVFKDS